MQSITKTRKTTQPPRSAGVNWISKLLSAYRGEALPSCRQSRQVTIALQYGSLESRQLLAGDPVLQWNETLLGAIRTDQTAPPAASRAMAMVHTAIHDAVNSIEHRYQTYGKTFVAHPQASLTAAVAAAAERTLSAIFPAQHATFTAKLQESLALVPDGIRETQGLEAGRNAADQILALRAGDGSAKTAAHLAGNAPGQWRPTLPGYRPSLLPQWPKVATWSLSRGDQFRPTAPPALSSPAYATALNQVKSLGAADSLTRTADQTAIAKVWAAGPGTVTPPGQWNQITADISQAKSLSLTENARLFALLNISLADAGIAAWDAKYAYDFWRPVSAIHEANLDGNSGTAVDSNWTPLLGTPPFSAYVSGHSTFSGAASTLLKSYFGTDQVPFTLRSEAAGVADRTYTSLTAAGDEAGLSRIYGGIHYSFDHQAGSSTGRLVAEQVWNSQLPIETKVNASQVGNRLLVSGTSADDKISLSRLGRSLVVYQEGREVARFQRDSVAHVIVGGFDGDDRIDVQPNLDVSAEIFGGNGNDKIHGARLRNWVYGQAGDDMLCGGAESDVLRGGSGNDHLLGLAGLDEIFGDEGWNKLCGGLGDDELNCFPGQDRIIGHAGRDRINWL